VTFGFLAGAVLATSIVPRLQWLNLARVGWWGRPVLAAVVAGALAGTLRRGDARAAVLAGGLAALAALWGVYALARTSTRVLFVERSFVRVVAADLMRLFAYAVPAGAAGAGVAWAARTRLGGRGGSGGLRSE
jgi:hypothetical protein